jgi:hypothetical protein
MKKLLGQEGSPKKVSSSVSACCTELETFSARLQRLKIAAGVKSDTDLAKALDVKQGSVSGAKKKQSLPANWFFIVSEKCGASVDWLQYGVGSMKRGEVIETDAAGCDLAPEARPSSAPTGAPLEQALAALARVNEGLQRENERLNKELREADRLNGKLQVELAKLKARAAPVEDKPGEETRKSA